MFSGCTLTLVHVRMEANGGREPKAWPLAVAGSDAVAHVELHRLWRPMEVHRLWRLMELHRLWRLMELHRLWRLMEVRGARATTFWAGFRPTAEHV